MIACCRFVLRAFRAAVHISMSAKISQGVAMHEV